MLSHRSLADSAMNKNCRNFRTTGRPRAYAIRNGERPTPNSDSGGQTLYRPARKNRNFRPFRIVGANRGNAGSRP